MSEQEPLPTKYELYRNIARFEKIGFFQDYPDRYPVQMYFALLVESGYQEDASKIGLSEAEYENARKIGQYRGEKAMKQIEGDHLAMADLDARELALKTAFQAAGLLPLELVVISDLLRLNLMPRRE